MTEAALHYAQSTVLIADPESNSRRSLNRMLLARGYQTREAVTGDQALNLLFSEPVDAVICDVAIPGTSGIEVCRQIREVSQIARLPVVLTAGVDDRKSRIESKKNGCDEYLIKPIDQTELLIRLEYLILHYEEDRRLLKSSASLKHTVDEQSELLGKAMAEIGKARRTLRQFNEEIVFRLSRAVEFRDDETGNHVQRMSRFCGLIASSLGMVTEMTDAIRIASALHDVGKIAIPDGVLHKPDKLTRAEMSVMRRHADIGHRLLTGSDSHLLELAATIALTHHERFDGEGYPRRLSGKSIPIEGRIGAVADVFDALTSVRSYKSAFSLDTALAVLEQEKGKHFDPQVVDAFVGQMEGIKNIMLVHADR